MVAERLIRESDANNQDGNSAGASTGSSFRTSTEFGGTETALGRLFGVTNDSRDAEVRGCLIKAWTAERKRLLVGLVITGALDVSLSSAESSSDV